MVYNSLKTIFGVKKCLMQQKRVKKMFANKKRAVKTLLMAYAQTGWTIHQ
jgi:hypothetical protein